MIRFNKGDISVSNSFFEQPILNSPYDEPALHHDLDDEGQPTDNPPIAGRRRSELITPVPKPKKRKKKKDDQQSTMDLHSDNGISDEGQEYSKPITAEDLCPVWSFSFYSSLYPDTSKCVKLN